MSVMAKPLIIIAQIPVNSTKKEPVSRFFFVCFFYLSGGLYKARDAYDDQDR